VAISSILGGLLGFLLWLSILISIFSTGHILWAVVWLFVGGGLTALLVSILAIPFNLLGVALLAIGGGEPD
jgi:hypothetical protein